MPANMSPVKNWMNNYVMFFEIVDEKRIVRILKIE